MHSSHTLVAKRIKSGFTLIELLIVIAIIGILASIVLVSLNKARQKGQTAKDMASLDSINTALQGYYAAGGNFPTGCWQTAPAGVASANWIPGVTDVTGPLPTEHRQLGGYSGFIFCSDGGENYKLINHVPDSMEVPSNLIDPMRTGWAWGYWTPGAIGY